LRLFLETQQQAGRPPPPALARALSLSCRVPRPPGDGARVSSPAAHAGETRASVPPACLVSAVACTVAWAFARPQ
jgi:hypothetical protein